jgi:hypothetical protein
MLRTELCGKHQLVWKWLKKWGMSKQKPHPRPPNLVYNTTNAAAWRPPRCSCCSQSYQLCGGTVLHCSGDRIMNCTLLAWRLRAVLVGVVVPHSLTAPC